MGLTYVEAFGKDLDKLLTQLETINKALKKNPSDAKATAAKEKLAPFLTKDALEKRLELAKKLDAQQMGKTIRDMGLPGW